MCVAMAHRATSSHWKPCVTISLLLDFKSIVVNMVLFFKKKKSKIQIIFVDCRKLLNRKRKLTMYRVWVQFVARKPLTEWMKNNSKCNFLKCSVHSLFRVQLCSCREKHCLVKRKRHLFAIHDRRQRCCKNKTKQKNTVFKYTYELKSKYCFHTWAE